MRTSILGRPRHLPRHRRAGPRRRRRYTVNCEEPNIFGLQIPIGNLAEWVGGLGTLAAVVLALGQLVRERMRDNRNRARAHAELIAAWSPGLVERVNEREFLDTETADLAVDLWNSSSQPVYGVTIFGVLESGKWDATGEESVQSQYDYSAGLFRQRSTRSKQARLKMEPKSWAFIRVLPPGRFHVAIPYRRLLALGGGRSSAFAFTFSGIEIAFTDRTGSHWVRRRNGLLERLRVPSLTHYDLETFDRSIEPLPDFTPTFALRPIE